MNIRPCLSPAALLLAAAAVAAPLTQTTAIHNQPNESAPVVGFLKAGVEPTPAPDTKAPEGWMAVALPGPHDVYIHNNELSKDLHVHPGAEMRVRPADEAPVLTTMKAGDKIVITGLRPGWTQLKLASAVIGYIRTGTAPAATPAAATSAAAPASEGVAAPPAPPPAAPIPPAVSPGAPGNLPGTYHGTLAAAKRFLLVGPRPDYPYQLENTKGKRIAYLDLRQVMPTISIERYRGNLVTVSGVLHPTEDGKNLVITVDSIHLK